jgi:hypothetical protein
VTTTVDNIHCAKSPTSDDPKVNAKIPEYYRTGIVKSVVRSVDLYYGLYLKRYIIWARKESKISELAVFWWRC